jgi:hypothetical protein
VSIPRGEKPRNFGRQVAITTTMKITAASKSVLQIVRAGTSYDIGLERLLTPEMRTAIAPSHPDSVRICQRVPECEFDASALCIYDRSHTVTPEDIASSFSYSDAHDFAEFEELTAPRGRLYAPILYNSSNVLTDEMYYDGLVELAENIRGRGIARSFYVSLETILRECGFRFLGGWHNSEKAASFFIRGGRRFVEEMIGGSHYDALTKAEGEESLLNPADAGMMVGTIRCLKDDDERTLVRPELQKATLDQRLSLLRRVMSIKEFMMRVKKIRLTANRINAIREIMHAMRERGIDVPRRVPILEDQYAVIWEQIYDIATCFTADEIKGFHKRLTARS